MGISREKNLQFQWNILINCSQCICSLARARKSKIGVKKKSSSARWNHFNRSESNRNGIVTIDLVDWTFHQWILARQCNLCDGNARSRTHTHTLTEKQRLWCNRVDGFAKHEKWLIFNSIIKIAVSIRLQHLSHHKKPFN